MGLAFRRVKTYAKAFVISALALVLASVVIANRNNTADVWFFYSFKQVNVLWLVLVSGAISVVSFWTLRRVRKVAQELRELRREKELDVKLAEQRRMASELQQQERRIDTKLKGSIAQEQPTTDQPS